MTALLITLLVWCTAGAPFAWAGYQLGRRRERRAHRSLVARGHTPRPRPRTPAREVLRTVRDPEAFRRDHSRLELVGKPAFGDRPAGEYGDLGCFRDDA